MSRRRVAAFVLLATAALTLTGVQQRQHTAVVGEGDESGWSPAR